MGGHAQESTDGEASQPLLLPSDESPDTSNARGIAESDLQEGSALITDVEPPVLQESLAFPVETQQSRLSFVANLMQECDLVSDVEIMPRIVEDEDAADADCCSSMVAGLVNTWHWLCLKLYLTFAPADDLPYIEVLKWAKSCQAAQHTYQHTYEQQRGLVHKISRATERALRQREERMAAFSANWESRRAALRQLSTMLMVQSGNTRLSQDIRAEMSRCAAEAAPAAAGGGDD